MPIVTVKTGGTHQFGNPGEASEFLDLFLEKAGLVKEFPWEARLEKMNHCSWDSPPVRVVGFKHWVIYLRVKPSINATVDHYVSLLIPDGSGYAAEAVYKQLNGNVKSFNRFIRSNGHKKKALEPIMEHEAAAPVPALSPAGAELPDGLAAEHRPEEVAALNGVPPANGVAPPADGIEPAPAADEFETDSSLTFDSLAGVTRHPEKLRYVLQHVDRVSQRGMRDALSFKKALRAACGWTSHKLRAVSLILAWLVKHDYVAKVFDGEDNVINYRLTPRGATIALSPPRPEAGEPPPARTPAPRPVAPPRPAAPEIEPGVLLIRFREKAQELADAGRRLETNREKYRDLQAQMKQLDEEYQEITRFLVTNREAGALLARLLEVQGSVPIRT